MAKDPDNLAAEFETENTGGLLSGFLAEEDEFDRRALWRLGSWGVAAVGCVIVAVMANQSSLIVRRDQVAAADLARQADRLQQLAKDNHNDARRLASAIDTLNTDRDRLYSRVSTLEQGLDSVTGAITRQATSPAATAPTSSAPATAASQPPTTPAPPAPAVAPVATAQPSTADKPPAPATDKPAAADKPVAAADKVTSADRPQPATDKPQATADKPAADKPGQPTATAELSLPVIASSSPELAKQEPAKADAPSPSTPLIASKSFMAPPDPAAGKLEPSKPPANEVSASPIPDVATAAPATDEEADEATAPKAKIQRTEFGVDLGTANSVNGLRALWRGLLKSKSNAALTALKPIIVIKENTNGLGMQLRLVAGPLNDAGTAARICAGLSLNQRTCETAIYDGQRLALKPDDEPAAAKPAPQQRRRLAPKRAATATPAPAVEEPKKPEPTTFSSMFGRKNQ
ncbi:hypothetical protein JQ604_37775 [Bradyrhizobium jicamae]|uniref:hypothetical protein n=1 Tax=Bradyrhizobium jicamae TaxID=280332 RepID=UPI001BAE3788|nr:hypothetical protein [Bradyrhizobium jicamae]MBR0757962.1 hypothetical protein [Bradyrhizobium jicamae]